MNEKIAERYKEQATKEMVEGLAKAAHLVGKGRARGILTVVFTDDGNAFEFSNLKQMSFYEVIGAVEATKHRFLMPRNAGGKNAVD